MKERRESNSIRLKPAYFLVSCCLLLTALFMHMGNIVFLFVYFRVVGNISLPISIGFFFLFTFYFLLLTYISVSFCQIGGTGDLPFFCCFTIWQCFTFRGFSSHCGIASSFLFMQKQCCKVFEEHYTYTVTAVTWKAQNF